MSEPIDPRGQDNPSTYIMADADSNAEMIRIMIQDQHLTKGMGGPLAGQPDAASFRGALDVGCGPGGWLIEAAVVYPQMKLTGIDISWRMIEYARAEAQAQHMSSRTEFLVMDALQPLKFSDASFDLVNTRASSSFVRIEAWPGFLRELLRVARPGGTVRVTEGEFVTQSTSQALTRIWQMIHCAGYKAGYSLTDESWGVTEDLERLLSESGCQQVQTQTYLIESIGGTVGGQLLYQNILYGLQTGPPFLRKWDCLAEDYEALYQQALIDIQQKDFYARGNLLSIWGTKPQEP